MTANGEPTQVELFRVQAQESAVSVRRAGAALVGLVVFYAVFVVAGLIIVLAVAFNEGGTDGLALGLGGAAVVFLAWLRMSSSF
jgi:hypothetical protein